MSELSYVLATAGHVDHGKSALVEALTGIDPDRLPEEKKRGITIDLGFAHLKLEGPGGTLLRVGIVDVPGHEDFVKNMVAGVGSIDAALLVVAADDGWMPQTEEHLQILTYLGLRRGVVALTKSDTVVDLDAATDRIRDRLRGTPLAEARIIATSVKTRAGLAALRDAVVDLFSAMPPPPDLGRPRLFVDRVFRAKGAGTVLTGTLVGGSFSRGQSIVLQPSGRRAHLRAIQTDHRPVDIAVPGMRVALNTPELSPHSIDDPRGVKRGEIATVDGVGVIARVVDVQLHALAREVGRSQQQMLRDGAEVKVHHGTAVGVARVRLLDKHALSAGETCLARLTLQRGVLVSIGDRIVLRSSSEQRTLCGGVILDPMPHFRRGGLRRDEGQKQLLRQRSAAPHDVSVLVQSAVQRDRFVDLKSLRAVCDVGDSAFDASIATLEQSGEIHRAGCAITLADAWNSLRSDVLGLIEQFHRAHPQQPGMATGELQSFVRQSLKAVRTATVVDSVCTAIFNDLLVRDCERAGNALRRVGYRPALPARMAAAGEACLARLRKAPFDPPSLKELCTTDMATAAVRFLIAAGDIVDLGGGVLIADDAYAAAAERIRSHLHANGGGTVSELKTLLGSNRRVMVPLLERMDRDGITRRDGNQRRLPE
ncbi:MAG: selenocysteine-specific translation elongation factor [Tepidisphaeraceae bacterium]